MLPLELQQGWRTGGLLNGHGGAAARELAAKQQLPGSRAHEVAGWLVPP